MTASEQTELTIFGGFDLSEPEVAELTQTPHSQLLAEAFRELTTELDTHGNTARFFELRLAHGDRLIAYWKSKLLSYQLAQQSGQIQPGQNLITGDEQLDMATMGTYEDDDQRVLMITRRTPTDKDEVSVTADLQGEIDQFMRPPTIKSEIRADPDEAPVIYYQVVLKSNSFQPASQFRISRFERTIVHEDPLHEGPYIKDTRVIDCSIFGVEGNLRSD